MTKKEFESNWDKIVDDYLYVICDIDELTHNPINEAEVCNSIENIFRMLKKLKNNKFYNHKEIETIYLIVSDDIMNVTSILETLSKRTLVEVWSIILIIFDELIKLSDSIFTYECSGNLLKFRDFWLVMNKKQTTNEKR